MSGFIEYTIRNFEWGDVPFYLLIGTLQSLPYILYRFFSRGV